MEMNTPGQIKPSTMNWRYTVCPVLEARCKGVEGGNLNLGLDRIMQAEKGTL
jgi:hypothetical protein